MHSFTHSSGHIHFHLYMLEAQQKYAYWQLCMLPSGITIMIFLPFDSGGWKSEIPTLPCCVLRAAS